MKWRELLTEGAERLAAAGVPDAPHDASVLLRHAGGMDGPGAYILRAEEDADPEAESLYRTLLARRAEREPLQYITGYAPFMGHLFRVRPGVLIPRFDTETLVMAALGCAKPGMKILDLCTGSGCVLLSVLAEMGGLEGAGTDISPDAIAVAKENAGQLGLSVQFREGDLFGALARQEDDDFPEALAQDIPPKYNEKNKDKEGWFDLIVSNPPYIAAEEIPFLMEEVAGFEPLQALDGGTDGLSFYRRIIPEARDHLVPGGSLMVEIGAGQEAAVSSLFLENGYSGIQEKKDLGGHVRVIAGTWNG